MDKEVQSFQFIFIGQQYLFLGKEELNYVLGIQEKGLSNRLGLKKKGGYPLWTAAFLTYY